MPVAPGAPLPQPKNLPALLARSRTSWPATSCSAATPAGAGGGAGLRRSSAAAQQGCRLVAHQNDEAAALSVPAASPAYGTAFPFHSCPSLRVPCLAAAPPLQGPERARAAADAAGAVKGRDRRRAPAVSAGRVRRLALAHLQCAAGHLLHACLLSLACAPSRRPNTPLPPFHVPLRAFSSTTAAMQTIEALFANIKKEHALRWPPTIAS